MVDLEAMSDIQKFNQRHKMLYGQNIHSGIDRTEREIHGSWLPSGTRSNFIIDAMFEVDVEGSVNS